MDARTVFRVLLVVVIAVIVFVALQVLRPASTREDQQGTPVEVRPGPESGIPEDVLRVPDMLQAYGGLAADLGDAYWYLPYAVVNDTQGVAMIEALRTVLQAGEPFPDQLQVAEGAGAGGTDFLYPVEDGVARRFSAGIDRAGGDPITEADIPLIVSQPVPGEHEADVLFMDGHLESVALGRFPLSAGFLASLSALDTPEHAEADARRTR